MLGENVKKLREKKKYTRLKLGYETGLEPSTILAIELGRTLAPRIDTIEKLAKALGVTTAELIK